MKRRAPLRGLAASPERVELPASTARYLTAVLRLGPGDEVELFDPSAGVVADATLEASSAGGALFARVGPRRPSDAAAGEAEITLLYALSKGDKVDAVVRDAAELGAARVVVVVVERSVVRLEGPRAEERAARWRRVADEAARQAGRSRAPVVEGPLELDVALAKAAPGACAIVLDPAAELPLRAPVEEALADAKPVVLAIGPEGGFTGAEIEAMERAGFVRARFGAGVLRTETAATAAMGAVRALEG
jgi:16S rRNA (uracil1498-N3)-methyltransferase